MAKSSRLLDLFSSIDDDEKLPPHLTAKNRIIICDSMNTFIRSFSSSNNNKFNTIGLAVAFENKTPTAYGITYHPQVAFNYFFNTNAIIKIYVNYNE